MALILCQVAVRNAGVPCLSGGKSLELQLGMNFEAAPWLDWVTAVLIWAACLACLCCAVDGLLLARRGVRNAAVRESAHRRVQEQHTPTSAADIDIITPRAEQLRTAAGP